MRLRRGGQLSMLFYVDLTLRHSLHGQWSLRCWWSLLVTFFWRICPSWSPPDFTILAFAFSHRHRCQMIRRIPAARQSRATDSPRFERTRPNKCWAFWGRPSWDPCQNGEPFGFWWFLMPFSSPTRRGFCMVLIVGNFDDPIIDWFVRSDNEWSMFRTPVGLIVKAVYLPSGND